MQIKWISRPNLPRLGLDLADFSSRGAYQFGGHTSEGRPIYAKYRSGWLTVMLENPDEVLLQANIGPAYHGSMLPEQVCDLSGMTVNGSMPTVSAERLAAAQKEEPFLDWSGTIMYWQPPLCLSEDGAKVLQAAVNKAAHTHDIHFSILRQSPRAHIVECLKHFDRPTLLPQTIEGWLHVSVAASDHARRCFLESLASKYLFNRIDIVDLVTQSVTHTHKAAVCYSRDLIDWCALGPDRYLAAHPSGTPPRMIGVRPAHDMEKLSDLRGSIE